MSTFAKLATGKNQLTGRNQKTDKNFASIPGLKMWIDPFLGVTKDGSNRISRIEDLSGNGNFLSQTTLANQPIYSSYSGYPSINIDSTSKQITSQKTSANTVFVNGGPITFFHVFVPDASNGDTTGTKDLIMTDGQVGGVSHYRRLAFINSNKLTHQFVFGGATIQAATSAAVRSFNPVTPILYEATYYGYQVTGSDAVCYENNTLLGSAETTTATLTSPAVRFIIGRSSTTATLGHCLLSLAYSWGSADRTTIDNYRAEVMALIKAKFSDLSLGL